MSKRLFTSESVTEGIRIRCAISSPMRFLDAIIAQDPQARVACEVTATTGLAMVVGEITTTAEFDVQEIVRSAIRDIGYDRAKFGFDCDTCAVITALDKQSPDIALGVDQSL